MIQREIRQGWRVYKGKIRGIVPSRLEIKYLEQYPKLIFVKDKKPSN